MPVMDATWAHNKTHSSPSQHPSQSLLAEVDQPVLEEELQAGQEKTYTVNVPVVHPTPKRKASGPVSSTRVFHMVTIKLSPTSNQQVYLSDSDEDSANFLDITRKKTAHKPVLQVHVDTDDGSVMDLKPPAKTAAKPKKPPAKRFRRPDNTQELRKRIKKL